MSKPCKSEIYLILKILDTNYEKFFMQVSEVHGNREFKSVHTSRRILFKFEILEVENFLRPILKVAFFCCSVVSPDYSNVSSKLQVQFQEVQI